MIGKIDNRKMWEIVLLNMKSQFPLRKTFGFPIILEKMFPVRLHNVTSLVGLGVGEGHRLGQVWIWLRFADIMMSYFLSVIDSSGVFEEVEDGMRLDGAAQVLMSENNRCFHNSLNAVLLGGD